MRTVLKNLVLSVAPPVRRLKQQRDELALERDTLIDELRRERIERIALGRLGDKQAGFLEKAQVQVKKGQLVGHFRRVWAQVQGPTLLLDCLPEIPVLRRSPEKVAFGKVRFGQARIQLHREGDIQLLLKLSCRRFVVLRNAHDWR